MRLYMFSIPSTLEQERNIWLEKTPRHLDFVDRIENLVERAKFVHIVRNGDEVIASLFHIGKEYSMEWGAGMLKIGQSHLGGAKYQSIDECIHTWVHYTRLSQRYVSKPNHYIVKYNQLVRDPAPILEELCDFIDAPFEKSMLIDYPKIAAKIVNQNEKWKATAGKPIQNHGNQKYWELFDNSQMRYILEHLPEDLQGSVK